MDMLELTGPRSLLALAARGVLPLSVTSWLASMGPTMRTAGAAVCAVEATEQSKATEQSNALAKTEKGRVRIFAMAGFLDPFFEEDPGRQEKLLLRVKMLAGGLLNGTELPV